MHKIKFATAINCMDGRTQEPIIDWVKQRFNVDFVDLITEPGPDKILSEGPIELINSIKNRVKISIEKHNSDNIIIVSHYDCTGNPVDREKHLEQLKDSLKVIKSWNLNSNIFGVWIDEEWIVKEIKFKNYINISPNSFGII